MNEMNRRPVFPKILAAILLLLAALPCTACAESGVTTTVFMYMCGSDLVSSCLEDIREMRAVSLPEDVRVVGLAGGSQEWNDRLLTDGSVTRFVLEGDGDMYYKDIGVCDMGHPQTLFDFLCWGVEAYPADRYMLIFWDHGGGSSGGVCYDSNFDDDYLNVHHIADALATLQSDYPGFHLDVIGFDACLMGNYEMAAHMAPYADYMVASEEIEPGLGWSYDRWLGCLAENPSVDTEALCIEIADSYIHECVVVNPYNAVTLSVIDLSVMEKLVPLAESFLSELNTCLAEGRLAEFSRPRQKMYSFGAYSNHSFDMVDFAAFLDGAAQITDADTTQLRQAYSEAVRYTICTDKYDYLTGLSLLWPYKTANELLDGLDGYVCRDGVLPVLSDFVTGLTALLNRFEYTFTTAAPARIGAVVMSEEDSLDMEATVFLPAFTEAVVDDENRSICVGGRTPSEESRTEPVYAPSDAENAQTAFSMVLSEEDLAYVSEVDTVYWMDMVLEGKPIQLELGTTQCAQIDWDTGEIIAVVDRILPFMNDQVVVYYEQIHNETVRRGYVPVKYGDQSGVLLVDCAVADGVWHIVGFTEGATESGLPSRTLVQLKEGDVLSPIYPATATGEDGEVEQFYFAGEPVTVGADVDSLFDFLEYTNEDEKAFPMYFAFRIMDIAGEEHLSELVELTF